MIATADQRSTITSSPSLLKQGRGDHESLESGQARPVGSGAAGGPRAGTQGRRGAGEGWRRLAQLPRQAGDRDRHGARSAETLRAGLRYGGQRRGGGDKR